MNRWWEPRREGELTTEFLGRVLNACGLERMARNARAGHYDDYFAPAEVADSMEIHRLVNELGIESQRPEHGPVGRKRIKAVRAAAMQGEFDATKAESDRWAASKDGQDTMRTLLEGR